MIRLLLICIKTCWLYIFKIFDSYLIYLFVLTVPVRTQGTCSTSYAHRLRKCFKLRVCMSWVIWLFKNDRTRPTEIIVTYGLWSDQRLKSRFLFQFHGPIFLLLVHILCIKLLSFLWQITLTALKFTMNNKYCMF